VLLSEHHSYPFGMELKGDFGTDKSVKRLYNFKERIGDFGLNWSDFGARYYLGNGGEPVFLGVDPVSEQFAHVSTFNYAENRPINGIDLHGLQFFPVNRTPEKNATVKAADKNIQKTLRGIIAEIGAGFTAAGVALDVKDFGQAVADRDGVGIILAMAGFVPGGGDLIKGLGRRVRNLFSNRLVTL
jgi:hypothetical protein